VCTTVSVARGGARCVATYSLRGGQITGRRWLRLVTPAPYFTAITGGAGKYQGAEGAIRVARLRTEGILTFHVED
jgi:hypothetical protein